MGKALRNRLDGNKEEFLKDVENHGSIEALELWEERLDGYKSYIGLKQFLQEETGDPDYGNKPRSQDTMGTFKKFIIAFSEVYTRISSENQRLREENEALKRELKIREVEDISLIFPLMDEIRGGSRE